MKVIISGYVGKKITGIGRNLICLLDNTYDDNEYIIYTNYDMEEELVFNNKNVKVKTYNVSKNSSFKNLLWTTFIFPFKVKKENADIALIPNFSLLLLKFRKTIIIMHDLIEFNVKNKFSKKKMFYRTKIADPISAKNADKIITVSENSKKDIIKFLNVKEDKITVIYNGVDQNKFHKLDDKLVEEIFKEKKWPKNFILYAGTIDHPGKNALSVIKAFEKIKNEKKYDGKLILAGMPGSGYEIVESYINDSKLKKDIILTGYVTDIELISLYSTCDLFCFLSLYEGFGIPPLEALACGAKVVVSNNSSLPEVVGSVGWKADPNSLDDICNKMMEAMHKDKDVIYQQNVKKHLEKYKWKKLSEQFTSTIMKN